MASPAEIFPGTLLVAAPHMDDEVLACGGTIAGLSHKERLHIVYATDGTRSPVQAGGRPRVELGAIRQREANRAMAVLGIGGSNLRFLNIADGELKQHIPALAETFTERITAIQPDHILLPFRFDRHPDHLALYQAVMQAVQQSGSAAQVHEYFVYNRYRLLPGGDIRSYVRPELLASVEIQAWRHFKRLALERYYSQTTLFYAWQNRPILPPQRIKEVSLGPEIFLKQDPRYPGASVFVRAQSWVQFVHTLEPKLKNAKERLNNLTGMRKATNGR